MTPLYIVDSFTSEPFKGNPAGVVIAQSSMDDTRMQSIATELGFSETAFVFPLSNEVGSWRIRYFSPLMEIPLCGHATLAASKILFMQNDVSQLQFKTHTDVELNVSKAGDRIQMAFPVYSLTDAEAPPAMLAALGIDSAKRVVYAGYNSENNILMLEIESSKTLAALEPDFVALVNSHDSINAVSVTAPGHDEFDFHSRLFWPWAGGNEDPVTGATHTFLAKYWSEKLDKKILQSFQSSNRTGQMEVEITDDRQLLIRGDAVLILEGELKI